METHDVIVVGSGATGSMAAQTLAERGAKVLMLDGGQRDEKYAPLTPHDTFIDIRKRCEDQHRFFLGDDFESVPQGEIRTGSQLTPARRVIIREVDRFLPYTSNGFAPMESLAFGGLGAGWGLGCCVFSDAELRAAGLEAGAMRQAYQTIASRIGISGTPDDAQPYTFGSVTGIQPTIPLDPTCAEIYRRYGREREGLRKQGFHLGRPALALLTEPRGERRATQLRDMDYYDNAEQDAWRPWITVSQLLKRTNFQYIGDRLVTRFQEHADRVEVHALDMRTLRPHTYACRKLVLAAGTFGTARVVLRSREDFTRSLPFLCNPYTYLPSVVPSRVGKAMPDRRTGIGQLVLFHDPGGEKNDVAFAAMYTYRSLLLFRLLRETPLNFNDARIFMRHLLSGLVIVGIHHPDRPSPSKTLKLEKSSSITGDACAFTYTLTTDEQRRIDERERAYARTLRKLNAWPIKRVHPGHGSSIHYTGTLPFTERENDRPHALAANGRLHGTKSVFVADGSGFTYLPAKSLTLSLMANAHLVAEGLTGG
jgi:choline dehydrogenase-like flavoprotein